MSSDKRSIPSTGFFDPYGRPYLMGETPPGGSFVWRTWTYRDELGDAVADMEVTARNLASMGLATNCAASLYDSGSVAWNGFLTQRRFDIRGNVAAIWNPEGRGTFFVRDGVGRLVQTYGATYPSARLLDTAGRLVALGTTRAGDVWDVTQWGYDPATGLCTNKAYADGTAVSRAFTADGLPSRTTLASGRWTQNAYDADRRLSATTDSDGNSVQYAYDAFGRLTSATDAAGHAETFARDALGRVTNETQTVFDELFWTNRTAVLDRPLDAFGRPAGLSLKIDGDFAQSVCYTYGTDGRMDTITITNAQGRTVSVEYDWEQGRLAGCTVFSAAGSPLFIRTQTRALRRPALVTAVTNAGVQPLTSNLSPLTFSYAYDAVGRPVSRDADAFAYNARGEVTNATISGATWGYAYDHIGNREAATAPSGTTAYAANALNQYTAVTGRSVAHDADGNMTRNGERNQTWDAAGRLVKSSPDLVQRWQTWQDFDYDYRGRRTAKYTQIFFGGMAPPVDTHLYFYDDWNLVHETTISETYQIKHVDYFWGPDLSGSLQGAGGVGGLVAVSIAGQFYFPGYDNNGNVIGYWDENGALVAEYAYDTFGNTIASSGSMASVFPHRFSTKYYDSETSLYYYGHRYYFPSLGRWISRDPISEEGGRNIFCFVGNHPTSGVDPLGLSPLEDLAELILQPYVDRIHYYLSNGMESSAVHEARALYVLIAAGGEFVVPLAADLLGNWLIRSGPDFRDPYILKAKDVRDALLDGRIHQKSSIENRTDSPSAFGMKLGEFLCCSLQVSKGAKENTTFSNQMTAESNKFSLALGTFSISFTGSVSRSKQNVIVADGEWNVHDTYDWHEGHAASIGAVAIPDDFALLVERNHLASSFEIKGSWKGIMQVDCSSKQMKARAQ